MRRSVSHVMFAVAALAVSGCSLGAYVASEYLDEDEPTAPPKPEAPVDAGSATPPPSTKIPDGPLPDRDSALAHRLVEQHGALLLDVRSKAEFADGHVDGAQNIPHDEVQAELTAVEALVEGDKHAPIVVYCRSGRRSAIAKEILKKHGYTRVTNLGGISDW